MKSFKEFQTESYSKLDEHWALRLAGGVLGGHATDKVYDNRVDQSNKGLDLTKNKPRKGNNKVKTALNVAGSIIGGAPDKTWQVLRGLGTLAGGIVLPKG